MLASNEEDGIILTVTEVRRSRALPKIAAKVLGSKQLRYIQHDRYDPSTRTLRWTVEVPTMGDRFGVIGTTTVEATATGSRRVVDGVVSVRVRLVGGAVERAIVTEFEKTARRAVEIARDVIDGAS